VDPDTGEVLDLHAIRQAEHQMRQHFPEPWPNFRRDVEEHLSDAAEHPVLVSRAPQRRNGGAAHEETIRSIKRVEAGMSSVKTRLTSLKPADLARLAGKEDPRNESLYAAIEKRLLSHGGDGAKAFAENQPPLYKPGKDGGDAVDPTGRKVVVRSVRLVQTQPSGLPVRGGIAKNDTMVRTDVFTKNGKFYLVPVYMADTVRGELPNRAIIAHKPESEWDLMDDTYTFLFSLHRNDYVVVRRKGKETVCGYFGGCHRGTGSINLWAHDRRKSVGKDGCVEGIGVKTAEAVEKWHVDVLGRLHKGHAEVRHGLAKRGRK
jgi:CRISPR-associated endonuclease Csn1